MVALRSILLLIWANVPISHANAAELDPAVEQAFRRAVPVTEQRLRQISVRVMIKTVDRLPKGAVQADFSPQTVAKMKARGEDPFQEITQTSEFAVRGDNALESGTRKNGEHFALAANDRYAFSIVRPKSLPEYTITWLEPTGSDPTADARIQSEKSRAMNWVVGTWRFLGKSVSEWLESPDFKITQAEWIDIEGQRRARIGFEHRVDLIRPGHYSLADGYLICDPARHWALCEYGYTFLNAQGHPVTRKTFTLTHGELFDGFPIASQIDSTLEWLGRPDDNGYGVTTISVIDRDIPEDVFHLSHYGLPEPNLGRFPSWRVLTWGGIGFICLLIALWLFWRRVRETRREAVLS